MIRTLTAIPLAIAAGVATFVGVLRLARQEMKRERESAPPITLTPHEHRTVLQYRGRKLLGRILGVPR
jgi:hypothetical protein